MPIREVAEGVLLELGLETSIAGHHPAVEVPLSQAVQQLLNLATAEADILEQQCVRPEHFLIALCEHGDSRVASILSRMRIERDALIDRTKQLAALDDEPPVVFGINRRVRIGGES
jgi:ATP-dependent Clp protease ATP-binding subunit ClpA